MRHWLIPHRDFIPSAGLRVRADFSRLRARLFGLHLSVYGAIDALDWHEDAGSGRCDELWRHGCFEAFLLPAGRTDYVELNFAPKRRWAAYRFDAYRQGMRNADVTIHKQRWFGRDLSVPRVAMQVLLDLPEDISGDDWHLNITTILEARDGTKSYWALAHAPGPPDFHNRNCFIASLRAPDPS